MKRFMSTPQYSHQVRLEVAVRLGGSSSRAARTPPASSGRNGFGTAFDQTEGLRRCTHRYCSQREQRYAVAAIASHTRWWSRSRGAGVALVLAAGWLAIGSSCATAQFVAPGYAGAPLPFLQGPDLAATLRNGAQMASDQSRYTAQFARVMSQRARGVGYQMQNLWTDYQNLEHQFQSLRATFNALGQLALQLQTPRAANAVAELEAGLNIISEAFIPVQQEMQANVLNRDTVVRMGQVMNEALLEWQKELKKCSSRLGTIR